MPAEFTESGVSFRYPESWALERETTDAGWAMSVNSPGTAFITVAYRGDRPAAAALCQAVIDTLREDYPDLEAEPVSESLAGQTAVGHDIRFFSLDLTNTCWVRSFYSATGTVLVLSQAADLELETYGPVLRAVCASLRVEG